MLGVHDVMSNGNVCCSCLVQLERELIDAVKQWCNYYAYACQFDGYRSRYIS